MDAILSVIKREIDLILNRKGIFFLIFIFPIIYGLFLGGIYSEKIVKKMPIAVYDQDNTKMSRLLLNYVQSSRSFNIVSKGRTLNELKSDLYQEKIVAFLSIPKGFQNNIKTSKISHLTLFISGSNYMLANLTKSEMQTIVQTISMGVKIKVIGKSLGISKTKAFNIANPVSIEMVKLHNPWFNYLTFLGPGFWMAALHQIMLLLGSLLIIREFEKKKFSELYKVSKNNIYTILISKITLYSTIMFGIFFFYFYVLFPMFDITIIGSSFLLLMYSLVFIITTITLGVMLSSLLRRSIDCLKGVLLIGAPAFLVSGYTWPLESMPPLIRVIASCIPLTPYLDGYRKIYEEGAGVFNVISDIGSMIIMIVVFGGIAILSLKYKVYKYSKSNVNVTP